MAQNMLLQRELSASKSTASPFPAVALEQIQKDAKSQAIYIDTCCLLKIVKSGLPLVDTINKFAESSTVVLVTQVMMELERNLYKDEFKPFKSRALAEICMLKAISQSNPQIVIEDVIIEKEIAERAKRHMYSVSSKFNYRLGEGELAILSSILSMKDIFNSIIVFSSDSDMHMLAGLMPGVRVVDLDI